MDPLMMAAYGKAGGAAAVALAAFGSAVGTSIAGMAAIGAWKKCYARNKPAPFQLLIFIGAPLSQTIYGMILMAAMVRTCDSLQEQAAFINWPAMISAGVLGGLAMCASAWCQGKAGAAGADALADTGQGFGNYLITIGIVETVALFVMVFIQATIR